MTHLCQESLLREPLFLPTFLHGYDPHGRLLSEGVHARVHGVHGHVRAHGHDRGPRRHDGARVSVCECRDKRHC